jgi:hypothetical protein
MCLPIDLFWRKSVKTLAQAQTHDDLPECQWIFQGVDVVPVLTSAKSNPTMINCTVIRQLPRVLDADL